MLLILWVILIVATTSQQLSADFVYGQGGSFATSSANGGGVSAITLSGVQQIEVTSVNDLYAVDSGNNRVLAYLYRNSTAFKVYGQAGSFTTASFGVTADSLRTPRGVAVSSTGDVYIADSGNNRVLHYTITSTTADRVYGQAGSFTTRTVNNGGASANSLAVPYAVDVDANGNLYVADTGNNRVLYYDNGSTTATRVYGQPDFTTVTGASQNNGIAPNTGNLNGPTGVFVSSSGVYIVDTFYNRVLYYSGTSTTPSRVYGQAGSYSSSTANNGGISANSLNGPSAVYVDSAGNVYIADTLNNRILYYVGTSTTASAAIGQSDLTSATSSTTSATSINSPYSLTFDSNNHLYVAQPSSNRITTIDVATTTPPTSPPTSAPSNNVCFHHETVITYKNQEYQFPLFHKDCHVPHVFKSTGVRLFHNCSTKALSLTRGHLVYGEHGLVRADSLKFGDIIYADLLQLERCEITKKYHFSDEKVFGLNCIDSTVLANGIKTSTFGDYHLVPAIWMNVIGSIFGVERASRFGDKLASLIY